MSLYYLIFSPPPPPKSNYQIKMKCTWTSKYSSHPVNIRVPFRAKHGLVSFCISANFLANFYTNPCRRSVEPWLGNSALCSARTRTQSAPGLAVTHSPTHTLSLSQVPKCNLILFIRTWGPGNVKAGYENCADGDFPDMPYISPWSLPSVTQHNTTQSLTVSAPCSLCNWKTSIK